ncbi:MAG: hypothetical protein R3B13_21860 [Polyangiaceae bacterium]
MRALLVCGATLFAATSCGPGEARDPGDILGDWREHNGVDARTGVASDEAQPKSRVASRAECEAAARRVETLALELVLAEESDPDARTAIAARIEREKSSADFAKRIEEQTNSCLERETTSTEAKCIAAVKNDADLDRCSAR